MKLEMAHAKRTIIQGISIIMCSLIIQASWFFGLIKHLFPQWFQRIGPDFPKHFYLVSFWLSFIGQLVFMLGGLVLLYGFVKWTTLETIEEINDV